MHNNKDNNNDGAAMTSSASGGNGNANKSPDPSSESGYSLIPEGSAMDLITHLIETTGTGSVANREPSTTCAVSGCTSPIAWPNNLCDKHRLTGVAVPVGNGTKVISAWVGTRGDEVGLILLNDVTLGELFGGRSEFEKRLGEQGFRDVRNLRTPEDLRSPLPLANGKKLASWSGPWRAKYPWEGVPDETKCK